MAPYQGFSFIEKEEEGQVNIYGLYHDSAITTGTWFLIDGVLNATVQFKNLETGASAKIHVSNNPTIPDPTDDEIVDQTVVGDGTLKRVKVNAASLPAVWAKVSKPVAGGTPLETDAMFCGVKR